MQLLNEIKVDSIATITGVTIDMKIPINPMKSSHEPENENILFYEIGVDDGWKFRRDLNVRWKMKR